MKGKKVNSVFLSDFISKCIAENKISSDDIIKSAKEKILEIDIKIIEAEKIKQERSNLMDVIFSFEKADIKKINDDKILSLFSIEKKDVCKYICNFLNKGSVRTISITKNTTFFDKNDIKLCIKNLIKHNIISKTGNIISKSNMFDDFVKNVLSI